LPVVTAALAAAATKAQARALAGFVAVVDKRRKLFDRHVDAVDAQRVERVPGTPDSSSSGSHRKAAAAAMLLLFLSIASAGLSKFCKFRCKRALFCLLVSAALFAQIAVINFHDFFHDQQQQPIANKLASSDTGRSPAANPTDAATVGQTDQAQSPSADGEMSLYARFLRRYSLATGDIPCAHLPSLLSCPIVALRGPPRRHCRIARQ
jgi:hypothetical protein